MTQRNRFLGSCPKGWLPLRGRVRNYRPWLRGWHYRKPFTLSRTSGAVSNYQMKLLVGESSSFQISNCESTTGWAAQYYAVVSTAEGVEGTNCIKIHGHSNVDSNASFTPTSPLNLSPCTSLTFRHKRSGAQTTGAFYIFSGTVNNPPFMYWNFTMQDNWTTETINLSSPLGGSGTVDLTATTCFRFDIDGNEQDLYIDDFRGNFNANCGGLCAADFDDIRFTTSNGTTLLDYWIESTSGTTPNQVATIWIEFDSIGTSSTTFYMYYGNSGASAGSNISGVFITADNFERGSNGDTIGGSWTEATAHVHISTEQAYSGSKSAKLVGGTDCAATIPVTASNNISIMWRAYKENTGDMAVVHNDGGSRVQIYWGADEVLKYLNAAGVYDAALSPAQSPAHSTWHLFEFNNFIWGSNTYDLWLNDVKVGTSLSEKADAFQSGNFWIRGAGAGGGSTWFDNFVVRNWRAVGPVWGTFGTQESA